MLLIRVVIVRKGQSIDSIPQKVVGHLTKLQTTQYQFSLFKKGKDVFQEKIKNEESQFRKKRSKKIQLRLSIALMYGHQGLALFQNGQLLFTQGHPTTIFGKYLFGRRIEIQNFRNICCKISCLSASPRIFEHLKNGIIAHF